MKFEVAYHFSSDRHSGEISSPFTGLFEPASEVPEPAKELLDA